ncbi:MAG: type II toxin-antitoxin system HicB family antitoxin [Patescibacteria group bacterium]
MVKEKKQFKVIIDQGEDGYFVPSAPALPGCHTQAKTLPQLQKRIKEAISLCLEIAKTDSQYQKRIKEFAFEPLFIGIDMVRV